MFHAPSQANLPYLHSLLNDIPGNIDQMARHVDISPITGNTQKMTTDAAAFNHVSNWKPSWVRPWELPQINQFSGLVSSQSEIADPAHLCAGSSPSPAHAYCKT